jgi:hypothetical protein
LLRTRADTLRADSTRQPDWASDIPEALRYHVFAALRVVLNWRRFPFFLSGFGLDIAPPNDPKPRGMADAASPARKDVSCGTELYAWCCSRVSSGSFQLVH